jgi:hypothetical protein
MQKFDVPEPVAEVVKRAFGLEALCAGKHKTQANGYLEIDTIWIVEFPFYFSADIYIAGVNETQWIPAPDELFLAINAYKGLLLTAPYAKFDFYQTDFYRTITMEWPDEMVKGLQSLNMLPHFASIAQADGTYQEYKVHTYWMGGGEGHASYRAITSQQPEIVVFHNAILHTIKNMAGLYNDSEINRIIEQGRSLLR